MALSTGKQWAIYLMMAKLDASVIGLPEGVSINAIELSTAATGVAITVLGTIANLVPDWNVPIH